MQKSEREVHLLKQEMDLLMASAKRKFSSVLGIIYLWSLVRTCRPIISSLFIIVITTYCEDTIVYALGEEKI